MMNIEELKRVIPKHTRKLITQNVVDVFNGLEGDHGEDFAEHYKQNFIGMSSIMKGGTYNTKDYMNAVKFSSFRLLQNTDIDSYMLTFPDRYQRLMTNHADHGDEAAIRSDKISPYVAAYKRNDLVVKVTEQALVPSRILNAPMFQQALNIQMEIAMTSHNDKTRSEAADSVMKYTMSPETQKIELEVGLRGQDEIASLRSEMHRLASQQQITIESGTNSSLQIAESTLLHDIIEVEE